MAKRSQKGDRQRMTRNTNSRDALALIDALPSVPGKGPIDRAMINWAANEALSEKFAEHIAASRLDVRPSSEPNP